MVSLRPEEDRNDLIKLTEGNMKKNHHTKYLEGRRIAFNKKRGEGIHPPPPTPL